ncbi:STAS domain-containing protein [Luteibacter sp. 329MFSha]|nr:STAS domain-containing protein [Luteibacter sp. 329MFSha]
MTGFVNALAFLIFMAQLPELIGVPWPVYPVTVAGLAIISLFPYVARAIPSPLVAIVVLTIVAVVFGMDIHRVGDIGALPDSLPHFLLADVPLNWETAKIVLPTAATLAVVGLLGSMMTLQIVNDMTDTRADKNRECMGQGLANIVTEVHVDVSEAHFWDLTAVGFFEKVMSKFRLAGERIEIVGMNEASAALVKQLGAACSDGAPAGAH